VLILRNWVVAAVVSLLPVWAVSSLLSDSVDPMVFDPAVGRAVPVAGIVHRARSEAWAQSVAGRHGIWGVPDIGTRPGPKVAIWGNSHVEGVMLPDEDKIAQQVTRLWRSRNARLLTAYGVGIGGIDIATVHALLPRYVTVAEPTTHHFVIVPDMAFLEPRSHGQLPALRPAPNPRFDPAPVALPSPQVQRALGWLHRLRIDFPYHLYDDARQIRMRWHPGRAREAAPLPHGGPRWQATPELTETGITETWSYLLDAMQQRAGSVPVSYLYCPRIPTLEDGKVRLNDPQEAAFEHFRDLCVQRGITCRSLGDAFVRAFQTHGVFARGFALNHPYRGHLNRHGNAAIARGVVAILEDAVHAD
jgi:hypothetical protein